MLTVLPYGLCKNKRKYIVYVRMYVFLSLSECINKCSFFIVLFCVDVVVVVVRDKLPQPNTMRNWKFLFGVPLLLLVYTMSLHVKIFFLEFICCVAQNCRKNTTNEIKLNIFFCL